MLIAFTTQVMASTAMSYAEISCTHASMGAKMTHDDMADGTMADDTMDHASMMLSDSNQEKIMDCCQEQCQCPMSGCVSLSFLLSTNFNSEVIAEQKILQSSSLQQSQINSSLYRPPIS